MSLVATKLQELRLNDPNFDRNMSRPKEFGAWDFFVDQTNSPNGIISPEIIAQAYASIGRDVKIPVINYDSSVTVASSRSCTISDDENTSALYQVVFATYAAGFTMVPTAYQNNEIGYNRDFQRKIEKISRAIANSLDTAAITALSSNKSQVYKDLLAYSESGNVVQCPWILKDEIIGDINPIMRANGFNGTVHLIGNAGLDSQLRKMNQYGEYNQVNKRLEFADKIQHFTTNIANETGKYATFYAVEDGNVAVVTRADREVLARGRANGHEWDSVMLPYIGVPVDSHYYTSVGDNSSIAGAATADATCTIKEHFGFAVDVAFIVAYNSAPSTIANPIMAVEVASSIAEGAKPVLIVNDSGNPVVTQEVATSVG